MSGYSCRSPEPLKKYRKRFPKRCTRRQSVLDVSKEIYCYHESFYCIFRGVENNG